MKKAGIIGFASWFPDTIRENNAWPSEFIDNFKYHRTQEELNTLVDLKAEDTDNAMVMEYLQSEVNDPFLGTRQRRVAPPSLTAVDAETCAARKVLNNTGIGSDEIDFIASYSTLPDRVMPSSANAVAHNIHAVNAHCAGIDTGCASTLSQMMIAKSLIESGQARYALLIQSHIVLRAWPMMHPASPNIGDCATAIVMGLTDKHVVSGSFALSEGQYYDSVTYTRGKKVDTPWWMPGDKPFYMGSHNSEKAKKLIFNTINAGRDTIQKAIATTDHQTKDIDLVISVQPRKWVPWGIARALGLPAEKAVQTFEQYAHLGPCGVVANLEEAERRSLLQPETLVAMYAQGAGFCRASVIIEW